MQANLFKRYIMNRGEITAQLIGGTQQVDAFYDLKRDLNFQLLSHTTRTIDNYSGLNQELHMKTAERNIGH